MDVPRDYVLELIRKHLDERMDDLNDKIDKIEKSLKYDIYQLRNDMMVYNKEYKKELKIYNNRLVELEKFKYKVIAMASVIALISSYIFKVVFV